MDQLIFASLSHPHYWYEVGVLKVPAAMPTHETTITWQSSETRSCYLYNSGHVSQNTKISSIGYIHFFSQIRGSQAPNSRSFLSLTCRLTIVTLLHLLSLMFSLPRRLPAPLSPLLRLPRGHGFAQIQPRAPTHSLTNRNRVQTTPCLKPSRFRYLLLMADLPASQHS